MRAQSCPSSSHPEESPCKGPIRLLSWASQTGGQRGLCPRGPASKEEWAARRGCSCTASPMLCWRGRGGGQIATPWSCFSPSPSAVRSRDSRPGPSVPAGELPPRVGRTSSARFPPRKQNEIFLWRRAIGMERIFQSLTTACSSHRLVLGGVLSLLNSVATDSFIPALLGWH